MTTPPGTTSGATLFRMATTGTSAFGALVPESAIAAGVKYSETNLELETNVRVHSLWKDLEKTQHKRRRAFIKVF